MIVLYCIMCSADTRAGASDVHTVWKRSYIKVIDSLFSLSPSGFVLFVTLMIEFIIYRMWTHCQTHDTHTLYSRNSRSIWWNDLMEKRKRKRCGSLCVCALACLQLPCGPIKWWRPDSFNQSHWSATTCDYLYFEETKVRGWTSQGAFCFHFTSNQSSHT